MDPFGVMVLASVTAIGGGTIRDMALGATPVFWIKDTNYLWVIMITCALTMLLVRRPKRLAWWILRVRCDWPCGFVGIGVEKARDLSRFRLNRDHYGRDNGCGGGIIRDVLAREIPMVLRSEVYATACIIGGIFHTTALAMGYSSSTALLSGVFSTLLIRLGAIRWHLSLPTFALTK